MTLKLATALEHVLKKCLDQEYELSLKSLLHDLFDLAVGDGFEETDRRLWNEARRWLESRPPSRRKARYISSETLNITNEAMKFLDCTRDEAFNAVCAVGLEAHLALLNEDYEMTNDALVCVERIKSSQDFERLINCLSYIDIGRDEKLKKRFDGLASILKSQLIQRRTVLDAAKSRQDALPLFIARSIN